MSLSLREIEKSYTFQKKNISILKKLNLEVAQGQSAAILGPSGSGKTTLLSILAGLEAPEKGEVLIQGQNLFNLTEEERTRFRAQNIGIVFQQFHLIPHLNAQENVALPLEILGTQQEPRLDPLNEAKKLLEAVGLGSRLTHRPGELSGGECQRVAIARSLIANPKLLLADEPSGNLDTKTGLEVMNMFFAMAKKNSITTVLVTHNEELIRLCDSSFRLHDGSLVKL